MEKVEQLLNVSGGISGQTLAEIIENQHKIIHLIKMVLKAVNVEIKGDSVDDIMSVLDLYVTIYFITSLLSDF